MNIRDYSTLHLDINSSKETSIILLFYISQSQLSILQWAKLIP